jgi:PmbA protein
MDPRDIVKKAMAAGAQGAQVTVGRTEQAAVEYESDKLKTARSSQETGVGLKVIAGGRIGTAHTTDMNDADGLVARAMEAVVFGAKAYHAFPGPAPAGKVTKFDAGVLNIGRKAMVDMGVEMMAIVKDHNPDVLVDAGVGRSHHRAAFANSAGAAFETESTEFGFSVTGQRIIGTDILWVGAGTNRCRSEKTPRQVAGEAVEQLRLAARNAAVRSGTMPVIFTPSGTGVLLLALKLGLNGRNVFMGNSPLKEKMGTVIADPGFTVTDEPLLDWAPASGGYDGEGVPRRPLALVEKGVVRNFLYDLDTAGRAKTASTGHGPGCGPTNTVIAAGTTPFAAMVKGVKEGVIVEEVLGLGQGNAISGEFSVNINLGYKIENGAIVGRVKDVMIAGNTYDALKCISAIGTEREWRGSRLVPHIMIDCLSVTAK